MCETSIELCHYILQFHSLPSHGHTFQLDPGPEYDIKEAYASREANNILICTLLVIFHGSNKWESIDEMERVGVSTGMKGRL